MQRTSVLAVSRSWTWSWGQGHVGQRHQASVRATAAAQPVSSGWPQHSEDISLVEAQLSGACGQMVAQCFYLAGETTNGGQRNPTQNQTQSPVLQAPRAHHGGLEGRAGACGSCRLSLGPGSRRAPTVCATSWNMDLSRLSQSEGSLGVRSQGFELWLRPGSPLPLSTAQAASHLFVGRISR